MKSIPPEAEAQSAPEVSLADLLWMGAAIAGALAAFGLIWKRIIKS